nr:hypothetical protein [uncultured Trichococcus sp.]
MSNVNKKELLLVAFDGLKGKIEKNSLKLGQIVGKMLKLDESLAFDMWKYLIDNGEKKLTNDGYWLSEGILSESLNKNDNRDLVKSLDQQRPLFINVVAKSSFVGSSTVILCGWALYYSKVDFVNDVFSAIKRNRYNNEYSFADIIDGVIDEYKHHYYWDHDTPPEEEIEFLLSWINQFKDEETKSSLIVPLIDFL